MMFLLYFFSNDFGFKLKKIKLRKHSAEYGREKILHFSNGINVIPPDFVFIFEKSFTLI